MKRDMGKYILRKLVELIFTLLFVTLLSFLLMRLENYDKIRRNPKTNELEIFFQGTSQDPSVHRKLLKYFDAINGELKNAVDLCESFVDEKYLLPLKTNVVNQIQSKGFSFSDLRLSLDYNAVTNLLMGEHIYGDRKYGLRELIQNSIDACKTTNVYHAHTTNVIALTFVLTLEDKVFTRELWEMATECPVVFPSGIGVVGWMVPGGREIAVATSALMKEYDVAIWAHHGMFCSGEDFDLTFGLMHTVEKSAEILVKMLSMRPDKRQTISPQNFRDLAKDFKVTLPEKFLYDK